jgi:CubicO group peptidase (beta-lactamase class C family)
MTRPFIFKGVAYLLNMVAVAIPLAAQADFAGLDTFATQELARHRIPCASIAVVRADRIVYSKVFGTANLETGEPMRPEMLVQAARFTRTAS